METEKNRIKTKRMLIKTLHTTNLLKSIHVNLK